MYLIFNTFEDIRNMYGLKNCKDISTRLYKVCDIHRQPRPHLPITMYVNRRCLFIQKVKPVEMVLDFKMDTRRKGVVSKWN